MIPRRSKRSQNHSFELWAGIQTFLFGPHFVTNTPRYLLYISHLPFHGSHFGTLYIKSLLNFNTFLSLLFKMEISIEIFYLFANFSNLLLLFAQKFGIVCIYIFRGRNLFNLYRNDQLFNFHNFSGFWISSSIPIARQCHHIAATSTVVSVQVVLQHTR